MRGERAGAPSMYVDYACDVHLDEKDRVGNLIRIIQGAKIMFLKDGMLLRTHVLCGEKFRPVSIEGRRRTR